MERPAASIFRVEVRQEELFDPEDGAACSSKMLTPVYQSTLCHIQEDCIFNLKSGFSFQFLILHSHSFNHSAWKIIYIIQHTVSHLLHFNIIVILWFRAHICNVWYPKDFQRTLVCCFNVEQHMFSLLLSSSCACVFGKVAFKLLIPIAASYIWFVREFLYLIWSYIIWYI